MTNFAPVESRPTPDMIADDALIDVKPVPPIDRNAALISVYPLLFWRAKQIVPRQDVEDTAHDAAILFLRGFDPTRAAATTFAFLMVDRARVSRWRKTRKDAAEYVSREITDKVAAIASTHTAPPSDAELAKLRAALAKLSEPMQQLLVERFGLETGKPKTFRELGGGTRTREAMRIRVKVAVKQARFHIHLQRGE